MTITKRLCIICRKSIDRKEMIRLTLECTTGKIVLNTNYKKYFGRSAYLCRSQSCIDSALKTPRIKQALEGRKTKGRPNQRKVAWPLEAQLMESILTMYTGMGKTCQNTGGNGEV
ncbi:MAG: YlxR family protein [Candidatus Melainabacteria bacterium]|nr:YlxR family protein [Candidatus Melainabacteria bacterium]MBX9672270.1 YlxR family protein [Candidatus Obscuribacterales bacterium]